MRDLTPGDYPTQTRIYRMRLDVDGIFPVYSRSLDIDNGELVDGAGLRKFSYAELVQITNNFDEVLGKGSSGTVCKGNLSYSQNMVAVKKLRNEIAEGECEFQTEMKIIAKTHHRNLISLVGYCIEGSNMLLVYEFMGNGSLADILFSARNHLSWTERVRIATDVVQGVLYLHEEWVRGTRGYVAPEWFRKVPVTVKADVYSFGIVLLEIICLRKNVDWSIPEDEAVLDDWVYDCFAAGEISKLVPDEEVDMKKLERWVKVGLWCIQDEPSIHPSMKKVLLMLEGTVDVPIPPNPSSS